MNKQIPKSNQLIKAILLLFTIVFAAEMTIMLMLNTVVSDRVSPWGFAVLDGVIISIVSLIAIYFMNSKSLINLNHDGRSEILILKVGTIIFSIEALIMFGLSLPEIDFVWWEELIIDSLLLSVFAAGLIYLIVIRPGISNKTIGGKDIVRQTFAANLLVFISFALLMAIIFYIVYSKTPKQDHILINTLTTLYVFFILVSGFVLFILNRSARQNVTNAELIHKIANFDALTNLGNRRYFETIVEEKLQIAEHNNHKIGLMFLDLDKFKQINDTHGHNIGDYTLKETANRIMEAIGQNDIACRSGGDEFAIILPKIESVDEAVTVAKRILEIFNQHYTVGNLSLKIAVSIGITLSKATDSILSLTQRADKAMYQSKTNDNNKYTIL